MYSQSIIQFQDTILDNFITARYKTYQNITIDKNIRFEIIDLPLESIIEISQIDKEIDISDTYNVIFETKNLDQYILRYYTENELYRNEIYRFSYFDINTARITKDYYELFLYIDSDENSVTISLPDFNKYSERNNQIDKINFSERYNVIDRINIVVV
jgi:hypothetical protein